jgi:hypothetical protein
MAWAFNLLNLEDIQIGMSTLYGSYGNQSKFLLGSVGLFHDIGYADLDQHKGNQHICLTLNPKQFPNGFTPHPVEFSQDFCSSIAQTLLEPKYYKG